MQRIPLDRYPLVKPLFHLMDHHLALRSSLVGSVPGQVYVDDPEKPRSALVWTQGRYFLGGSPEEESFNQEVRDQFTDTIYPEGRASGRRMFTLFCSPQDWDGSIGEIFPGKELVLGSRQYYECRALSQGWHPMLPKDHVLLPVDQNLLDRRKLHNLDQLEEEMCSERPSLEDFLTHSFGVCLVHHDTIIGWCLSEYNCGDRCEIGIEVVAGEQRKGSGTLLTQALVQMARSNGYTRIGWHSRANNIASSATALKAGFMHLLDYSALYGRFD